MGTLCFLSHGNIYDKWATDVSHVVLGQLSPRITECFLAVNVAHGNYQLFFRREPRNIEFRFACEFKLVYAASRLFFCFSIVFLPMNSSLNT